jgi:hypothetical protein
VSAGVATQDDRGTQVDFGGGSACWAEYGPHGRGPLLSGGSRVVELYQTGHGEGMIMAHPTPSQDSFGKLLMVGYPRSGQEYVGYPTGGTVPGMVDVAFLQGAPPRMAHHGSPQTLAGKGSAADVALQEVRRCREFMEMEAAQLRRVIQQQVLAHCVAVLLPSFPRFFLK